ncbi:hypothetical protein [Anaerotignum sp.]
MNEKQIIRFFKEFDRMCAHFYDAGCACPSECPLKVISGKEDEVDCAYAMIEKPETVVPIVLQWSKENPERTRLVDFLEKHPNAPLNEKGYPKAFAKKCGYVPEEVFCRKPCSVCWETDVEEED